MPNQNLAAIAFRSILVGVFIVGAIPVALAAERTRVVANNSPTRMATSKNGFSGPVAVCKPGEQKLWITFSHSSGMGWRVVCTEGNGYEATELGMRDIHAQLDKSTKRKTVIQSVTKLSE